MTRLLELIFSATVLLGVVLMLRGVLKNRISARLRYALWLLAAVRLLVPFSVGESALSVLNAMPSNRTAVEYPTNQTDAMAEVPPAAIHWSPEEQTWPKAEELDTFANTSRQTVEIPVPVSQPVKQSPLVMLFWVWLVGVVTVGGCFLCSNLYFYGRLRHTGVRCGDIDCSVPVYMVANLPAPCLTGLVRQRIYLNTPVLDSDRLQHVLTHELCHRWHGDNWWALVRGLCLTLWWFHPLVWVAAVLSRRDCEMACDEAAVRSLGELERIPYGQTLVSLAARRRVPELLRASTAMTTGSYELKERLRRIVSGRRTPVVVTVLVVVLAFTVGVCTLTGAQKPTTESDQIINIARPGTETERAVLWSEQGVGPITLLQENQQDDAYQLAVAQAWAVEFGAGFYGLEKDNAFKAMDMKVVHVSVGNQVEDEDGNRTGMTAYVAFAIKPWYHESYTILKLEPDCTVGSGDLQKYLIFYVEVPLYRADHTQSEWYSGRPEIMTRGMIEACGLSLEKLPDNIWPLTEVSPKLKNFYPEDARIWEKKSGEDPLWLVEEWVWVFLNQFERLEKNHPASSLSGAPILKGAPEIHYRDTEEIDFSFIFSFKPKDKAAALDYFYPDAWEDPDTGEFYVKMSTAIYRRVKNDEYFVWQNKIADMVATYPEQLMKVDAREQTQQTELDVQAIKIPDVKRVPWHLAFQMAWQFCTLSSESPLASSTVFLMGAEGIETGANTMEVQLDLALCPRGNVQNMIDELIRQLDGTEQETEYARSVMYGLRIRGQEALCVPIRYSMVLTRSGGEWTCTSLTPALYDPAPRNTDSSEQQEQWNRELTTNIDFSVEQEGTGETAWQAVGEAWGKQYIKRFLQLSDTNPMQADDVKLLGMDLLAYAESNGNRALSFEMEYATRPTGDMTQCAVNMELYMNSNSAGSPKDLEDYFVQKCFVTLQEQAEGVWSCTGIGATEVYTPDNVYWIDAN